MVFFSIRPFSGFRSSRCLHLLILATSPTFHPNFFSWTCHIIANCTYSIVSICNSALLLIWCVSIMSDAIVKYSHDVAACIFMHQFIGLDAVIAALNQRHPYHRSHISRMRMDRFNRIIQLESFTVFILGAKQQSVPICMYNPLLLPASGLTQHRLVVSTSIMCYVYCQNWDWSPPMEQIVFTYLLLELGSYEVWNHGQHRSR